MNDWVLDGFFPYEGIQKKYVVSIESLPDRPMTFMEWLDIHHRYVCKTIDDLIERKVNHVYYR